MGITICPPYWNDTTKMVPGDGLLNATRSLNFSRKYAPYKLGTFYVNF